MSPISTEMNGNVSGQALNSSSNNPSANTTSTKSMLEHSQPEQGVNFNTSDSLSSGGDYTGPVASTPIADRNFNDGIMEQPSSSTENFGLSIPKFGTLIPNRVFVGGISCHTTESELMQLFSGYGMVKATKIIMDRTGISKGYGFVTFETEDEAKRLINAVNNRELPPFVLRDRRLNIAPAVKKQPLIRQNSTYVSQGSIGASSTFSPPPFDSFYCGQSPQDFLIPPPPVPIQDNLNFLQQPNGFPSTPSSIPSSAGQFFHSVPNFGMGQTIPGPNGSIIFLPYVPSFQQPFYT